MYLLTRLLSAPTQCHLPALCVVLASWHVRQRRPVNADTRPEEGCRKVFRRPSPNPQHPTVSNAPCARVARACVISSVVAGLRKSGLPSQLLDKLQSVQNAAVRLISSASRHVHIMPILRSLHWLLMPERIEFRLPVLVYRCGAAFMAWHPSIPVS